MTAQRHRDSLLARMIPAQSLAAGRVAVPSLAGLGQLPSEVNFDMNAKVFRAGEEGPLMWPAARTDTNWRHSDLREVGLPFVAGLYRRLAGQLSDGETGP